jgi:ABC-type lipoprotein export system ATPase subunit
VLDIRDLTKSYVSPEGERTLVIDVRAFHLAKGEQAALQGSSGSGKTTFLNPSPSTVARSPRCPKPTATSSAR